MTKKCLPLLLFLVVGAIGASGEEIVGKLLSIEGEVGIDTFGSGDFISAYPGDTIYGTTVIETEVDSSALIIVNDREVTVPPDSKIEIASIAVAQRKRAKLGWFSSLVAAVKSVFGSSEREEEIMLGGRASEAPSSDDLEWALDDEDDEVLFEEGLTLVEDGNYLEAINKFSLIMFPKDITLPGELDYWLGVCLYQLENYEKAREIFSQARIGATGSGIPMESASFYPSLLFHGGVANYMTENQMLAVEWFEELIHSGQAGDFEPFAYLLTVNAYREMNQNSRANDYLKAGLDKYLGSDYEDEFRALLSEQ